MHLVIKGCKTIDEYKKTQQVMNELVQRAAAAHKAAFEKWEHGEAVKAWRSADSDCDIVVEYESGSWWHYKFKDNGVEWW